MRKLETIEKKIMKLPREERNFGIVNSFAFRLFGKMMRPYKRMYKIK